MRDADAGKPREMGTHTPEDGAPSSPAGWRLASLSSGPKGSIRNNVRDGMFRLKEKAPQSGEGLRRPKGWRSWLGEAYPPYMGAPGGRREHLNNVANLFWFRPSGES